ncbi:MAG: hypothetical protein DRI46_10800 [Chloroflexi bacterium]|nr:MAG: hypothetical protein DRI46_10800 [Chloroflexota bacterium]
MTELEKPKTKKVPVVRYKDFTFPVDFVRPEEVVDISKNSMKPIEFITELRATQRELRDRSTIMLAAFAALANGDDLKEFLDSIGLVVDDFHGKRLFGPEKEVPKEDAQPQ